MHPNNTEELLQSAEAWLQQATDDLRQHMEGFMNAENMSPEDLAELLALTPEEINAVLEGNVDGISLRTFANVLIANGLALAIQPVVETPIGHFGGPRFGTQRRGFMPPPPQMGRPMPRFNGVGPQGGQHIRPEDVPQVPHAVGTPQPRNARGQFARRPTGPETDPYFRLTIDALRDIVTRNHWNYEIDVNSATREELINFLKEKEKMTIGGIPTNRSQGKVEADKKVEDTEVKEIRAEETVDEAPAEAQTNVDAIAQALAKLFRENPDVANTLGSLINK